MIDLEMLTTLFAAERPAAKRGHAERRRGGAARSAALISIS